MRAWAIDLAAAATLFPLLVGRLIVGVFPPGRGWGFDQARYFSFAEIIPYSVGLLFLWFAWAASAGLRPSYFEKKLFLSNPRLLQAAGILLFTASVIVFADSTNLLGDGLLRAAEITRQPSLFTLRLHAAEPLNFILHNFAFKMVFERFGIEPAFTYRFFSWLAGISFLAVVYSLSCQLTAHGIPRWLTIPYIFGWGGMLFFFGYVESYPPAAAAFLFLFSAVLRYIETGRSLTVVIFLFCLAFFLHNIAAVFLVPLTLLIMRNDRMPLPARLAPLLIMWAVVAAWGIFGYPAMPEGTLILPSSASEKGYSLLSAAHLFDILNELLLVSPFFPLLLILPSKPIEGNAAFIEFRRFTGLTTLFSLACLFIIDPKLGMPRDWDLFCLPLLAFHLHLLLRLDWNRIGRLLKAAVIVFPMGITLGWIMLNADAAKSLARYEKILQNDWNRSRQGYERLAGYHLSKGNITEAERAFVESLGRGPTARSHIGLGFVLLGKGELEQAGYHFSEAQRLDPDQGLAIVGIGEIYRRQERWDELGEILNTIHQRFAGRGDPLIDGNIRRLEQDYNRHSQRP